KTDDLDQVLSGTMHVVVPDLYDEKYDVRFSFDTSGIPGEGATDDESEENDENDKGDSNDEKDEDENGVATSEDNPKTGDSAPILLFAVVLLASGFVFIRKVAMR